MKSSFCDTNACIEVEYDNGWVWISSDDRPHHSAAAATPAEWLAFVAGVKNGDFDNLVPAADTT